MSSTVNKHAGWDQQLANIIDYVDSDELPGQLVTGLSTLVSFAMATVFVLRGQSRPICIYENFPDTVNKIGIENFVGGTYVLNPVYHFSSGFTETHKVTVDPDEQITYMTEGWPRGFEELDIAVPIDDVTIEVDLYKKLEDGGFSDSDIETLSSHMPVIGAVTRKFWQLRSDNLAPNPRDSRINEIYDSFGASELSNREREVQPGCVGYHYQNPPQTRLLEIEHFLTIRIILDVSGLRSIEPRLTAASVTRSQSGPLCNRVL